MRALALQSFAVAQSLWSGPDRFLYRYVGPVTRVKTKAKAADGGKGVRYRDIWMW
jgi:hypothetical protein